MSSSLWELSLREGRSGLGEDGRVCEKRAGSARSQTCERKVVYEKLIYERNDYLKTSHAIRQTKID